MCDVLCCACRSLLISTETWHRRRCSFSPCSSICSTPTPILSRPTHTHPQSHNIPLAGFVLWGCGRVSSHKWISPHIPLSIKEPVCVPTAARGTPLQLFVLSDTSTCYLYLCISGYLHLTHLEATLIRFLPYFFFNPCYWIIWVILQVYGLKTINVVEDRLWTLSFSGTNIQFNSNILRAKVVLTDICNNISNILNTVFCAHLICVF